jgi:thioesterase-3
MNPRQTAGPDGWTPGGFHAERQSQMASRTEIKIRGYHLDFYGHVNNARYLEFLEEGRWSMFEENVDLKKWQQQGRAFFVVNINISYRKPVSLGDVLEVRSSVSTIGERSGVIRQEVYATGPQVLMADADITFVIADIGTGKALPLTGDLRQELERLKN